MVPTELKFSRNETRARRELLPNESWVPDVGSPSFVAEAHRQSLAVANSPDENADQGFVDAVSDWDSE